jgi:hypothetical protein
MVNVVSFKRRSERRDVLRGEAGQRHCEVEPHADLPAAVVLEAVELLVGLHAAFAQQDFQVLEGGRIDRAEAVGAKCLPRGIDNLLARQHGFRQIVAEAL